MSLNNTVAFPDKAQGMGGPVTQSFKYDGLYRLTHAQGIFQDQPGSNDQYTLDMAYDPIHNILSKNQVHTLTHGQPKKDQAGTFDFAYQYNSGHPHAPTHIGDRTFTYDADGNQTGFTSDTNGQKRTNTWDEENRIQSIAGQGSTSQYKYDESGQRAVKLHQQGETVYVNQFYIVRNGALFTKEVFAGTARVAAKLEPGKGRNTPLTPSALIDLTVPQPTVSNGAATLLNDPTNIDLLSKAETKVRGHREELDPSNFPGQGDAHRSAQADQVAQNNAKNPNLNGGTPGGGGGGGTGGGGSGGGGGPTGAGPGLFLYYYHPDHLGSTQFVSTQDGSLSEHVEYIPFGETWVDEGSTKVQSFLFTSKELDTETGLYYFGARYYDPRTSVWQSTDPILGKYLPTGNKEKDKQLPSKGVFGSLNINLYQYAGHNPVKYVDADGNNFYVKLVSAGFGHEGVAVDVGNGKIMTADYGMSGYTGTLGQDLSSAFGSHDAYVNVQTRNKSFLKQDGMQVLEFKTSKKMDAYIKSLIENTFTAKTHKEDGTTVHEAKEGYNAIFCNCGDYSESILKAITGGEFSEIAIGPGESFKGIKENKEKIQGMIDQFAKEKKLDK